MKLLFVLAIIASVFAVVMSAPKADAGEPVVSETTVKPTVAANATLVQNTTLPVAEAEVADAAEATTKVANGLMLVVPAMVAAMGQYIYAH